MLYEFVQIARLAAPQHRRRPMLSRPAATLSIMDNLPRLHPGLRIRCPHCRQWHPAIRPYNVGTEYTQCCSLNVAAVGITSGRRTGRAVVWKCDNPNRKRAE